MSKIKKQYFLPVLAAVFFFLTVFCWKLQEHRPVRQENTAYLSEEYIEGKYLDSDAFSDVKCFPLAKTTEEEPFSFEDSFGGARTYGGNRTHEGCDIMIQDNIRGSIPVVSVCDGTVTNLGWLELGGYRIGVSSDHEVYYYYAHLYRYDEMISEGDRVKAGQILGYAGDSGYGPEGTTGQFAVHLHFGIYQKNAEGEDVALNPYPLLKNLTNKILKYF